jgi:hypothetical protein
MKLDITDTFHRVVQRACKQIVNPFFEDTFKALGTKEFHAVSKFAEVTGRSISSARHYLSDDRDAISIFMITDRKNRRVLYKFSEVYPELKEIIEQGQLKELLTAARNSKLVRTAELFPSLYMLTYDDLALAAHSRFKLELVAKLRDDRYEYWKSFKRLGLIRNDLRYKQLVRFISSRTSSPTIIKEISQSPIINDYDEVIKVVAYGTGNRYDFMHVGDRQPDGTPLLNKHYWMDRMRRTMDLEDSAQARRYQTLSKLLNVALSLAKRGENAKGELPRSKVQKLKDEYRQCSLFTRLATSTVPLVHPRVRMRHINENQGKPCETRPLLDAMENKGARPDFFVLGEQTFYTPASLDSEWLGEYMPVGLIPSETLQIVTTDKNGGIPKDAVAIKHEKGSAEWHRLLETVLLHAKSNANIEFHWYKEEATSYKEALKHLVSGKANVAVVTVPVNYFVQCLKDRNLRTVDMQRVRRQTRLDFPNLGHSIVVANTKKFRGRPELFSYALERLKEICMAFRANPWGFNHTVDMIEFHEYYRRQAEVSRDEIEEMNQTNLSDFYLNN